uniref:HUN domain-containing protein n=1 Tax=Parastrongyloides trichosuri TaxID=131310 RepID=A0A0N4ZG63_PARTI
MPHSVTLLGGSADKRFESCIVTVDLFLSTNHSYVDIDMNKIREENNLSNADNNSDGIDSEAMRISKLLEMKYQKQSKVKGLHLSKADLKKKDYGYVAEDDFIDDEDDFDELIPFHLDTALGGCYINEGPSELRAVIEIDAEEAMLEEDESDLDKSEDELVAADKQSNAEKPVSESSADEVHLDEEDVNSKKRKAPTPINDSLKRAKTTISENTNVMENKSKGITGNSNLNEKITPTIMSLLQLIKERQDPTKKFRVNDDMMELLDEIIKAFEKENCKNRDINKVYVYVAENMNIGTSNLKDKLKTYRTYGTIMHPPSINGSIDNNDTVKSSINTQEKQTKHVIDSQVKASTNVNGDLRCNKKDSILMFINSLRSLISKEIEHKVQSEITISLKNSDNKKDNITWGPVLTNYIEQFLKLFIDRILEDPSITHTLVVDTFTKAINDIIFPYFNEIGNTQTDFHKKISPFIEKCHGDLSQVVNKKQNKSISEANSGKESPVTVVQNKNVKESQKQPLEQSNVPVTSTKPVFDKKKIAEIEKQIKHAILNGTINEMELADKMLNDTGIQELLSMESVLSLRSLSASRKQQVKQNSGTKSTSTSQSLKSATITSSTSAPTNGSTQRSSIRTSTTNSLTGTSSSSVPQPSKPQLNSSVNVAQNVAAEMMKQAVSQQLLQHQQQNALQTIVTSLLSQQNQSRLPQNLMRLRNSGLSEAQLTAFINNPNQQYIMELMKQAATRNRQ